MIPNGEVQGRDFGQRWMLWRNRASFACPPYGCVSVFQPTVSDETPGRMIFNGGVNDVFAGTGQSGGSLNGVAWNTGFNWGKAVEPGGLGYWTCDLPAWCMINGEVGYGSEHDVSNFMNDIAVYAPGEQSWGLDMIKHIPPTFPDNFSVSGFMLLTTLYLPHLAFWRERPGGSRIAIGSYRIGLVGGLSAYLRGGFGDSEGIDQ